MTEKQTCSTNSACAIAKPIILGLIGGAIATFALWNFLPKQSSNSPIATKSAEGSLDGSSIDGIAVIDLQQILVQSKAGKSLQAQLDKEREDIKASVSKKEKELKAKEKEIAKLREDGNESEFNKKRKEFEANLAKARKQTMQRKTDIDEALADATAKLRDEIVSITAKLGQERGYSVVITRSNVVIVSQEMDITSNVLEEMDKTLPEIKLDLDSKDSKK